MNQQQLKEKINSILDSHSVGVLSTIKNNEPDSRYMTFYNEDMTLYTPTHKHTHKADEIKENPNAHILLGYEGNGEGDSYLEIKGEATINESQDLKYKIWNDNMNTWFEGPFDPNYIVLEIKPSKIRLMNDNGDTPEALKI